MADITPITTGAGRDTTLRDETLANPEHSGPLRCRVATGIDLEYVTQGSEDGEPLILLHGLTDSWRSFEPLLPHLPPDVRAFAISLRGHGRSDRPGNGYTMRAMADDVIAFMDAMRIEKATMVGHSMGARVAMRAASDHPARVRRLMLLGAVAPGLPNPALDELKAGVDALTEPDVPAFAREFQEGTVARPVMAGFVDTMISESMRLPPWTWRAALDGFLGDDLTPQLSGLRMPILLAWGARDGFVPLRDQEMLCANCPDARLQAYAGTGHAIHWEDPAGVAADLLAFMGAAPLAPAEQ